MVGPLNLRERLNKLSTAETIQKWHTARGGQNVHWYPAELSTGTEPGTQSFAIWNSMWSICSLKKLSPFHAWFILKETNFCFYRKQEYGLLSFVTTNRDLWGVLKAFLWNGYFNVYMCACMCVNSCLRMQGRAGVFSCLFPVIEN